MTKKTGMENRKQLLIFNIPTRTFVGESQGWMVQGTNVSTWEIVVFPFKRAGFDS